MPSCGYIVTVATSKEKDGFLFSQHHHSLLPPAPAPAPTLFLNFFLPSRRGGVWHSYRGAIAERPRSDHILNRLVRIRARYRHGLHGAQHHSAAACAGSIFEPRSPCLAMALDLLSLPFRPRGRTRIYRGVPFESERRGLEKLLCGAVQINTRHMHSRRKRCPLRTSNGAMYHM